MSSFERTAVWPNSSTTSWAVSWSIGWLIVAITPIFIMVLMTSLALTAMRLASSPTVIVSGSWTSRLTGAVGNSKPWRRFDADLRGAAETVRRLLLLEARAGVRRDVQFLAAVLRGRRALAGSTFGSRAFGRALRNGYGRRRGCRRSARRSRPDRFRHAHADGLAARRSPSLRSRSARSRACCSAWAAASASARRLASSSALRRASASSRSRSPCSAARRSASCRSASRRCASSAPFARVDFFLPCALLFFEHGAIQVGLLATHLDRDRARAALRATRA